MMCLSFKNNASLLIRLSKNVRYLYALKHILLCNEKVAVV